MKGRNKIVTWGAVMLAAAACSRESNDELDVQIDATEIEAAEEEAASEVTEENADETLEQLEAELRERNN